MMKRALQVVWIGLLAICSSISVQAADSPAHDLVRGVSQQVETLLADYRAGKLEGEEGLNNGVAKILDPVVSFKRIAAGVMGSHRKTASKEQKAAFLEKFKTELIRTYAKGMVGLGEFTITVIDPEEDVTGKRRVSVLQDAITAKGTTRIAYTMAQSRKTKQWKLINVVLDGVNMGKTFAGQFDDAMQRHSQDLDAVIATWGAEVENS
ncbi:ABC transporter substrate-binding protein [uncultured Pseudoteredinibacter sp.]|uniref:MlaC/ttg2D family ABC transporter substrate-binding protein n=1 Tax=uncultured Pseudoteredinibacter sp. TaxID=1641701 RepID=UPI002602FD7F|nr:ABC transporter substrate-binding protein [uncultured Pseudoteredinibacter sp.]